jgi:hypothetical protein
VLHILKSRVVEPRERSLGRIQTHPGLEEVYSSYHRSKRGARKSVEHTTKMVCTNAITMRRVGKPQLKRILISVTLIPLQKHRFYEALSFILRSKIRARSSIEACVWTEARYMIRITRYLWTSTAHKFMPRCSEMGARPLLLSYAATIVPPRQL